MGKNKSFKYDLRVVSIVYALGERCETERNECEPVNPCLNSGRCVDHFNNFSCICNPGMIIEQIKSS
jgi:hypothetical protein